MSILKLSGSRKAQYFPELDSIRGLSFLFIFVYHTLTIKNSPSGKFSFLGFLHHNLFLGVEIFFVLSAFLLTWLALNESRKKGGFSIGNYFVRRILRIWPLYFAIILFSFLIFPQLASIGGYSMTLPAPLYYIFFIANFYTAPQVYFLQFLWTISVEEQFYLFWGITLKLFMKKLRWIIAILILTSLTFSISFIAEGKPVYFNTLYYLMDFGFGAMAAILFFEKRSRLTSWLSRMKKWQTVGFYLYLPFHFLLFFFFTQITNGIAEDLVLFACRFLFIIYMAILMIEQLTNPSRLRLTGKSRFLIFTGRISYGLYCFHGITLTLMRLLRDRYFQNTPFIIFFIATLALTYLVASISYYKYELPFLRLKSKFRRI